MTSERFWGLVLGNLGVFDGVPAELQMVPDGCNGRNGRCNRWIPLTPSSRLIVVHTILLLFCRLSSCKVLSNRRGKRARVIAFGRAEEPALRTKMAGNWQRGG